MYQQLNLPNYDFRIMQINDKTHIFDPVRRRFVVLTPEEWVRQNFIRYLSEELGYPMSLTAVERQIVVNDIKMRYDLVIYQRSGHPLLIAEFKAPGVKISQEAFDQAVRYNMTLKVDIVLISNGLQHYVCKIDYESKNYRYLPEIPKYSID